MSNWITDNKPAALTTGVGLLLFVGLTVAGFMANSEREDLDKKITDAKSKIEAANKAAVTPSAEANKSLEKKLAQYTKAVNALKTDFKNFEAASVLAQITPNEFQNELKNDRAKLMELCKAKNIQITDTSNWLGFQLYSTTAPSQNATPTLNFELSAINDLCTKLADCGLTKFLKVYRPQLKIELPPKEDDEEEEANGPQKDWTAMPVEIAFQGTRQSVLKAVNAITGNKDYLFTINAIRIRNTRMLPPPVPTKPAADATPAATDDLRTPEEKAEDANAPRPAQAVVVPYTGNEEVAVQVTLNLIHFAQPKAKTEQAPEE